MSIINTIILLIVFLLLIVILLIITKLVEKYEQIEKILFGKYVVADPSLKSLVDLANYYWRLESKINNLTDLSENDQKRLKSGLRGIKTYLDKNNISIDDYTNRKYVDGMNLEIIDCVTTNGGGKPIIKEVIKPEIMFRNSIAQVSQVIIEKGGKNE